MKILSVIVLLAAALLVYLFVTVNFVSIAENGNTYAIQKTNYLGFKTYLNLNGNKWYSIHYHDGKNIVLFTDSKELIAYSMIKYNEQIAEEKRIILLKEGFK